MNNFTIEDTVLQGVKLITPKVYGDERGFFMETYHRDAFVQWGIDTVFIQDNHSKSQKGVLRWLHFQIQHTQAKLVRVAVWSVLDIVVDVRVWSPSFGQYIVVELSASNKQQLFVPKWCAHGFLALEDNTEFLYKCDDLYTPEYDSWIVYNDPEIGIDRDTIKKKYDIAEFTISPKDQQQQTFAQYKENPVFRFLEI